MVQELPGMFAGANFQVFSVCPVPLFCIQHDKHMFLVWQNFQFFALLFGKEILY